MGAPGGALIRRAARVSIPRTRGAIRPVRRGRSHARPGHCAAAAVAGRHLAYHLRSGRSRARCLPGTTTGQRPARPATEHPMCGITGIFDTRNRRDIDRGVLQRMNDSQLHRGPDEGSVHVEPGLGFGHRRLSIIDIATGQLLAAMGSGLPVVATAVGGNVELVEEGATGLLGPAADPEALAGALIALASDPGRAAAMGSAGRAAAEARFSLDATVDAYRQVCDQAPAQARLLSATARALVVR